MSVKLIAVDMDGSFLSDAKTYNRARFLAQYARMKAQGIRFVVASGNQYYQLISFFPEIAHEIAFVAENGGWVVDAGEDVFNGELSKEHFLTVATLLNDVPGIEIIACGKNSAYTLKTYNDLFTVLNAPARLQDPQAVSFVYAGDNQVDTAVSRGHRHHDVAKLLMQQRLNARNFVVRDV